MTPLLYPSRINFLRQLPPQSIGVEVGVCRGEFSQQILDNMPSIERLHLVDSWKHLGGDYEHDPENVDDGGHDDRHRMVRERFAHKPNVTIHRMLSLDAVKALVNEPVTWIYLDANHTRNAVYEDLVAWSFLKPRIIMGHDYRCDSKTMEMRFGVVEAVTDFCRTHGYQLKKLTMEEWPSYWLEKE